MLQGSDSILMKSQPPWALWTKTTIAIPFSYKELQGRKGIHGDRTASPDRGYQDLRDSNNPTWAQFPNFAVGLLSTLWATERKHSTIKHTETKLRKVAKESKLEWDWGHVTPYTAFLSCVLWGQETNQHLSVEDFVKPFLRVPGLLRSPCCSAPNL